MTHAPRVAPGRAHVTPQLARRRRTRRSTAAAGTLVGALACVAIVLGSSGAALAAGTATVDVGSSSTFGNVLTDAQGLALYTFPQDKGSMSACDTNAECASVWPALTVPAGTTPTAGSGVTGTVRAAVQTNGVDQVTYNGAPLYTFVGDSAPGQVSGNGVGGFMVVVVSSVAPTTTPTTAPTGAPPSTTATTPVTSTSSPSAPPARSPASPTAATSPSSASSAAPSTAAAGTVGTPAPAIAAAASPALASTGVGPGLVWIAVAGVALLLPGTAALFFTGAPRRRGRRDRERIWLVEP